jgi:hypothetical protein
MVVSVDSGLSQPIHGFQLIESRDTVIPLQLIQPVVPLQQGQLALVLNQNILRKMLLVWQKTFLENKYTVYRRV